MVELVRASTFVQLKMKTRCAGGIDDGAAAGDGLELGADVASLPAARPNQRAHVRMLSGVCAPSKKYDTDAAGLSPSPSRVSCTICAQGIP